MLKTYRTFSVIAILLVFAFTGLNAQQTTGTITGVVSDETGGVLPGVEVTARNIGTEATRTVISDDEGRYRLSQLSPGDYELRAELAGFQTAILQDISLSMAQDAVVSVTLQVGQISEQVVVSADVALVETTSGMVAALVDSQQIRDLPLNGRDFIQLAALQEGVITPVATRRSVNGDMGVKINIAGARPTENAILLDGTDIKNAYGTTPGSVAGVLLGVDTIREFRVITSAFTAEYGRFSGGVISAVTKSGTNEFHGTVFEFHRNRALDARNFFDRDEENPLVRSKTPPFIRNQFGFTLGGPIVKDKTFFFGSYEGLRERLTTTSLSNFPDADAHNGILPTTFRGTPNCFADEIMPGPDGAFGRGRDDPRGNDDFCQIAINPAVQPYLDLFPIPNGQDLGNGIGRFSFANPAPTDEDFFMIKVDHKLSDRDDVFVRYTIDDGSLDFLTETYVNGLQERNRNQYTTVEWRHIFSPTMLNEARFAYNRSNTSTDDFENIPSDENLWFIPPEELKESGFFGGMGLFLCRGCGVSQFGTTTRTPQKHTLNTFQYMDNLVWTRGRHALKLGVSWSHFQYNLMNIARSQGSVQFENVGDLLRGWWQQTSVFFGDLNDGTKMSAGLRQNLIGIYIQDDFQFRPNLTFNMGLRYEFITSPTEVNGRIGNLQDPLASQTTTGNPFFKNPSLKNYSPRVAFAWDPTGSGKFSIRGGYGLFFDQVMQWCCSSALFRSTPFGIRALLQEGVHGIIRSVGGRGGAEIGRDEAEYRALSAILCPDCNGNFIDTFPNSLRDLTGAHPGVAKPALFVVSDPTQPYLQQWSLTLQAEVLPDTAVTVGYVGSRGTHIPQAVDKNRPTASQDPDGTWFYQCDTVTDGLCVTQAANPNFTNISDRVWDRNSFYHALKLGLRKRHTSGFSYQVSYQFQRSIDEGSTLSGSPRETFNDQWQGNNWLDHRIDRGLSNFSIQQVLSTNFSVDLPFGRGRTYGAGATGFMGKLIEGWAVNGILNLSDGAPQNILGPDRVLCTSNCAQSRPSLVAGGNNNPVTGDPNAWFGDPEDNFELPAPGRFGNLGRNTAIGPGLAQFDFSIHKRFFVGDTADIQFRAEFFNLFNRTNFQGPVRSRGAFTSGGGVNGTFGELTETATTSRQIQFALKINF